MFWKIYSVVVHVLIKGDRKSKQNAKVHGKEGRRDEKKRWKHCSKCTAYCFGAKNKGITRGNKIIKVVFLHLITYVTRYENWDFRITIQKYEATKLQ